MQETPILPSDQLKRVAISNQSRRTSFTNPNICSIHVDSVSLLGVLALFFASSYWMESGVDGNSLTVSEKDAKRAEDLKNRANDYFKGAVLLAILSNAYIANLKFELRFRQ